MALPQGLHAPFVTTAALVIFGLAQISHAFRIPAVYLAGIIIGNRPTRAHNSVVVFLDAATWLAQIVMFGLLGLLASPQRLLSSSLPAIAVAAMLMLVGRGPPRCVIIASRHSASTGGRRCSWPGSVSRGAVAIFLAPIPLLVGMPKAYLYFDVAFVVVVDLAAAAGMDVGAGSRGGGMWRCRAPADRAPRRVELDLPGQLEQQLVGYAVRPNSLFPAPRHSFRPGRSRHW